MWESPLEDIEIETYRECTLCCGIIDKDDRSLYFWDSEKLVNVCRDCAGKLLKEEWRIIGIIKILKNRGVGKTRIKLGKELLHFKI